MAGNTPQTPVPSPQPEAASNTAEEGHTRPAAAPTPHNPQRAKRQRNVDFVQAPSLSLRKGAASNTDNQSARNTLENRIHQEEQQLQRKRAVLAAIGTALDRAVATFDGPHQATTRHECRETVNNVLSFLSTHAFTASGGCLVAPHRIESTRQGPGFAQSDSTSDGAAPTTQGASVASPSTTTRNASWASVASGRPAATILKRPTGPTAPRAAKPPSEDLRVLVTLSKDGDGLSTAPPRQAAFLIRTAIVQTLQLSAKQIPDTTITRTGYAIVAADVTTRDLLLEDNNAKEILRICGGASVSRPEKWYRYAVKEVPYSFRGADGSTIDTTTLIEEVFIQTKMTPRDISISQHGADPQTGRGTFIVSFLQPAPPFRLFSTSQMARLVDKKPLLRIHDPGCQGYCTGNRCKRVHRCGNCGDRLDKHVGTGACSHPVKCANCCGPFKSGHADCPAKPTYQQGRWVPLGKKARAATRAAGNRQFAEVNDGAATAPGPAASSGPTGPKRPLENSDVEANPSRQEAPSSGSGGDGGSGGVSNGGSSGGSNGGSSGGSNGGSSGGSNGGSNSGSSVSSGPSITVRTTPNSRISKQPHAPRHPRSANLARVDYNIINSINAQLRPIDLTDVDTSMDE